MLKMAKVTQGDGVGKKIKIFINELSVEGIFLMQC
jgi:hypothetical protein